MDKQFGDPLHQLTLSEDGSYTAYSKEYGEHYHSTKDGALKESLVKHVIPALELKKGLKKINILDICFGLGFNTLATLYYAKTQKIQSHINIYSPELDTKLIDSLLYFSYPKEFQELQDVVKSLVTQGVYKDHNLSIELYRGDARVYLQQLINNKIKFDILYQDAFSPATNPILWTKEYFKDVASLMKEDGIVTTYSTAFKTRLALYQNGFHLYINSGDGFRNATLASKTKLTNFKKVDMVHKIECNKGVVALSDSDL